MNKRDILLILISVVCSVVLIKLWNPVQNQVSITESNGWSKFVNNRFGAGSAKGTDFIKAAKIGSPAVVKISVRLDNEFWNGEGNPIKSEASGVIISSDGYIVTNHHVLEAGNIYEVMTTDKKKWKATLVGSDESTDIAVLKISKEHSPFLTMANSDSVQIGQWVIAIGNPYHLGSTVTSGIISAKGRAIDLLKGEFPLESFIQTDAVFNEGNSGGALINEEGELIGVNTAIFTKSGKFEGYSFSIPSNIVRKMAGDIISYGKVQRAMLGVGIEDINDRLAKRIGVEPESGVFVNRVTLGSAAQKAGLEVGDIITRINGIDVFTYPGLQEQVALYKPGDRLNIEYKRNNKSYKAEVELTSPLYNGDNIRIRADKPLKDLGFELRDNSGSTSGIFVHTIYKNSLISKTKMEPGFLIKEVNGIKVLNVNALLDEISKNSTQILFAGNYNNDPKKVVFKVNKEVIGL